MTLAGPVSATRALMAALGALVLTLAFAATAHAANTFTVNTTADNPTASGECTGGSASGDCSLRQALDASSDGDTILVPPPGSLSPPAATYQLTGGQLAVTHGVTIESTPGNGPRNTSITGQVRSRVFSVDTSGDNTSPASIRGLTITGGNDFSNVGGGGVYVGTPLDLSDDAVIGNTSNTSGGGVYENASSANPATSPSLTIESSLIAGNKVAFAADAPVHPAAVFFDFTGGGVGSADGGLAITNTTLTGNSVSAHQSAAGGGAIWSDLVSPLRTLNVTVDGNSVSGDSGSAGGGIAGSIPLPAPRVGQPVELTPWTAQNTIVSRDTVNTTTPSDCVDLSTTSDHNISTDASCGFTDAGSRQNTDPAYTSASPQNNGGDTDTLGINEASPAFNTGDGTGAPNLDQRGVARPQAAAWDIGAFEYVPSADLQITKTGTPSTVTLGHDITYTLTVRNNGPDPASGVSVADTLPISETLVSAMPSQGTCSATTCTLGNLGSGASATITIVARANAVGSVTNTASVHGNEADPNPANNTAAATNAVAAPKSLARPKVHASAAPCYRNAVTLSVSISSKAALKGVRVLLNGKLIETTKKKHFTIHISKLNKTHNTLTIVARNGGGKSPTKHITLRRCPTPQPRFTG